MTDHSRMVSGDKPNWSLATSFGGGYMGHDSPYYDSLYNQLDDQLMKLVSEEDPWGWDRAYYGLFTTEKAAAKEIGERYGADVYKGAVSHAHSDAKKKQLVYLTSILAGKQTTEELNDLMNTVDLLIKNRNPKQIAEDAVTTENNAIEEAYQRYLADPTTAGDVLDFKWFSELYALDPSVYGEGYE